MALMPLECGVIMLCDTIDPQFELDIDFSTLVSASRPLILHVQIARGTVAEVAENLRNYCFVRERKIAELNAKLVSAHIEVKNIDENANALQQSHAERNAELDALVMRSATFERLNDDLSREFRAVESRLSDREAQISALELRTSELLHKMAVSDEEAEALRFQLVKVEGKAAALRTTILLLESDNRELVTVSERLRASKESIQEELEAMARRVAGHEQTIKVLTQKSNQQIDLLVAIAQSLNF